MSQAEVGEEEVVGLPDTPACFGVTRQAWTEWGHIYGATELSKSYLTGFPFFQICQFMNIQEIYKKIQNKNFKIWLLFLH